MLSIVSRASFLGLIALIANCGIVAPAMAQHHHHHSGGSSGSGFNSLSQSNGFGNVSQQPHHHHHHHPNGNLGVYVNGGYSNPVTYTTYNGYSGYWSNGTFVYATAPTTYVQPVAAVQQVVVNRAPQNLVPAVAIQPASPLETITILNPAGSGGDVRYSLNGTEYLIKEGYSQTINNDRTWTVDFGSGGAKGDVRYTLSTGVFKFMVTQTGWDLMRAADQSLVTQTSAPAPVPMSVATARP